MQRHRQLQMAWFVAIAASALFAVATPATAAVITTYDFDDTLGSAATLNGTGNWVSVTGTPNPNSVDSIGTTDKSASQPAVSTLEVLRRKNDSHFSYNIGPGTVFSYEYDIRIGISGNFHRTTEAGLVSDTLGTPTNVFNLGYLGVTGDLNKWRLRGLFGNYLSTSTVATGVSEYWHIRLDVDLAANGGEGSATMYAGLGLGVGTPVSAVAGIENVNLLLATNGLANSSLWDGMFISMQAGSQVDEFTITATPEPSTALLAMLGIVGLVARRRRKR